MSTRPWSAAEPFLFANADSFTIPAGILTTIAEKETAYVFTFEVGRCTLNR